MGSLARFLGAEFARRKLPDWRCTGEVHLLDSAVRDRLGFDPRCDVLLTHESGRRVVIEFEISRADPVANQAKFFVARGSGQLGPEDTLISMLSPHIQSGRRNLVAAFSRLLRTCGLPAFQVSLLRHLAAHEVAALNGRSQSQLAADRLPIRGELDRVLAVARFEDVRHHRIHFAGDATDVVENLHVWNETITGPDAGLWGRRRVQFFVCLPGARPQSAPAKFCAFLPATRPDGPPAPPAMTLEVYASLGEQDPRFDGHRARRHLVRHLAFRDATLDTGAADVFATWLRLMDGRILVRTPARFLLPPAWYSGSTAQPPSALREQR
ncbi:MAG: hypothetical protein HY905_01705 [Deltaproteobacteria bacterium]|nr:hypothetical protein [Deltaproteobacteria bacterium]